MHVGRRAKLSPMERHIMCNYIPRSEVTSVRDNTTEEGRRDGDPEMSDPTETLPSIEAYEIEEGVVFYEADNPLAWLQSSQVVPLDEQV